MLISLWFVLAISIYKITLPAFPYCSVVCDLNTFILSGLYILNIAGSKTMTYVSLAWSSSCWNNSWGITWWCDWDGECANKLCQSYRKRYDTALYLSTPPFISVNSSPPGRCGSNFVLIFQSIVQNSSLSMRCKIAHSWVPENLQWEINIGSGNVLVPSDNRP